MRDDTTRIRVLIADDHPMVRRGITMFLGLDPELELVGEASTGGEAIRLAHQMQPDVVLMDLLLPDMSGVEAIAILRRELPHIEVVALTSVIEDALVVTAIRSGAIGYLLKTTDAEALATAVKAAAQGKVQLSPEAAARLMREVRAPSSPEKLTGRETEILHLVALGRANKQIAHELGLREQTIKAHVSHILDKLGVQSRTQAALYAVHIGLVSERELNKSPG